MTDSIKQTRLKCCEIFNDHDHFIADFTENLRPVEQA